MVNFTADFTGDGWPDIIGVGHGRRPAHGSLRQSEGAVTPLGHLRVLPSISTRARR